MSCGMRMGSLSPTSMRGTTKATPQRPKCSPRMKRDASLATSLSCRSSSSRSKGRPAEADAIKGKSPARRPRAGLFQPAFRPERSWGGTLRLANNANPGKRVPAKNRGAGRMADVLYAISQLRKVVTRELFYFALARPVAKNASGSTSNRVLAEGARRRSYRLFSRLSDPEPSSVQVSSV
jgi:hypothetical protein